MKEDIYQDNDEEEEGSQCHPHCSGDTSHVVLSGNIGGHLTVSH